MSKRAALESADTSPRNSGVGLGHKVAAVRVPGAIRPQQRLLWVSSIHRQRLPGWDKAGEVECAQLQMRHWDVEGPQLSSQHICESRQGRAYSSLRRVEWRVDRRDDGRSEDEDLWRDPFLADGLEARGEQRKECLDRNNGLQQVGVKEVGESGGRDRGDG